MPLKVGWKSFPSSFVRWLNFLVVAALLFFIKSHVFFFQVFGHFHAIWFVAILFSFLLVNSIFNTIIIDLSAAQSLCAIIFLCEEIRTTKRMLSQNYVTNIIDCSVFIVSNIIWGGCRTNLICHFICLKSSSLNMNVNDERGREREKEHDMA